ncbi:DUF4251 domain-containing protein [Alistipes sp.]|uniref:DUF4251 domain-containing protein n=1 Tax=Alistipes sp. TaxID=1872444 RepID=UPI003AF00E9A
MRPRIFYLLALATLLAGCAAQKKAQQAERSGAASNRLDEDAERSEAAYAAALHALEAGEFHIEAREFRFNSVRQAPLISSNSYVQMHAGRATVEFGPHITGRSYIIDESMYHQRATITREKPTSNGDLQFTLRVSDPENLYRIRLAIRLFRNTNTCLAKVYYGDHKNPYDFKGYIYQYDPKNATRQQ